MNRFALIIGLEKYSEPISRVVFAENDAMAFRDCLLELGYDSRDVTCLTNSQATKAKIESELRRMVNFARENDRIILFFAGHGFSAKASNYLVCHDTVKVDLLNTSLSLQLVLDLLKSSSSNRKMFFLDGCHNGLRIDQATPGKIGTMDDRELVEFFANSTTAVGFVSCQTHELSYTGSNFKQGIWTYNILQALRGVGSNAIDEDRNITSVTLRNYLALEVPKTLRVENPNQVSQTPMCYGNISKEFGLFNVGDLIDKRLKERKTKLVDVEAIDLLGTKGGLVRELSGFKKGLHQVPDTVNGNTESFVARIAAEDVEIEANQLYEQIKSNFKYKRRDIKLELDGGAAVVATKDFDLSITYFQDLELPGSYSIEYLINNVRDPEAINDEGLQSILNCHFDEVRFSLRGKIDLVEIIDEVESVDNGEILMDYPADCSSISMTFNGCHWSIKLSQNGISIVNHHLESPKTMLEFFKEGQSLISKRNVLRDLLT